MNLYDPFTRGPSPVGVRTIHAHDRSRSRLFPCEIWYPVESRDSDGTAHSEEIRDATPRRYPHPLVLYSHGSGLHRRSATYLCRHLAGHGYVVAAMDHSEVVAEDLAGRGEGGEEERAARVQAVIGSRVPDVQFLLDLMLDVGTGDIELDAARVGLVGYSFGGWTVLATTEIDPRVHSVVAMGPGGGSNPQPGILPLRLSFDWGREVPTLYLAAEDDVSIPLLSVIELFERTPSTKRLFILRRADHQHFIDNVEEAHEALRAMTLPGEAAWIPAAMRPIGELCPGMQAHLFVRGVTLAHLDATLHQMSKAKRFLNDDVEAELTRRGVEAITHRP